MPEPPDQTRRALAVASQRGEQLVARHARLQGLRVEVGGDQGEGVVVPVPRRRARPEIDRQPHRALAADELVGRLAQLALGEAGDRGGDAVDHHVHHAQPEPPLWVGHHQGEALGAVRRVGPCQRRGDALADAVRIVLAVTGVLHRQRSIVGEGRRGQHEHLRRADRRHGTERRDHQSARQQQASETEFHDVSSGFFDATRRRCYATARGNETTQ